MYSVSYEKYDIIGMSKGWRICPQGNRKKKRIDVVINIREIRESHAVESFNGYVRDFEFFCVKCQCS